MTDIINRLRAFDSFAVNPAICKEAADHIESLEARNRELEARIAELTQGPPVAIVESWVNGSYSRKYAIRWLKDVEADTCLYTRPAASGSN